jgi:hypothetical protein
MKAILEFDLPEDQPEFNFATQGSDWWNVCWQMDQWLRVNIKHAPDSMSNDEYKAYERCREELREIINNSGLNLDQ